MVFLWSHQQNLSNGSRKIHFDNDIRRQLLCRWISRQAVNVIHPRINRIHCKRENRKCSVLWCHVNVHKDLYGRQGDRRLHQLSGWSVSPLHQEQVVGFSPLDSGQFRPDTPYTFPPSGMYWKEGLFVPQRHSPCTNGSNYTDWYTGRLSHVPIISFRAIGTREGSLLYQSSLLRRLVHGKKLSCTILERAAGGATFTLPLSRLRRQLPRGAGREFKSGNLPKRPPGFRMAFGAENET